MAAPVSRAKVPGKTLGGQPLWVWGVAAGVMIVAAVYLYRKNAANAAAGGSTASAQPAAGGGPAQYGATFGGTVTDIQAQPTIVRQCPQGYNYRTRGPHAGKCVRASKAP